MTVVKQSTPPSNGRRRALIAVAALGVLVYVAAALAADADRLRQALAALGAAGCAGVFALSALNYGLRFIRWQTYVRRMGHEIPAGVHFSYYLSGFAFTVSPAKVGEAVRSVYLRNHGVTYSESMAALFCERLLDMLSMVILASLIVFEHLEYRALSGGALVLTLALLWGVSRPAVSGWLRGAAGKVSWRRLSSLLGGLANLVQAARTLLMPRPLALGTLLGLVAWGAEGIGFYWICTGLSIHVTVTAAGRNLRARRFGRRRCLLPARRHRRPRGGDDRVACRSGSYALNRYHCDSVVPTCNIVVRRRTRYCRRLRSRVA